MLEGSLTVKGEQKDKALFANTLGVLGNGDKLEVSSAEQQSRFLIIAGIPLNEPVARGGPFVMNTEQEVRQAFIDYQTGQF